MRRLRRGGVLVFVLWVIIFLSMTALSLGQRSRVGLSFIEAHIREVKAKGLAWAGIINAVDQMRSGSLNGTQIISFEDGAAVVNSQDEAGKINLNALGVKDIPVLMGLALFFQMNEDQSRILADQVLVHIGKGNGFYSIEEFSAIADVPSGRLAEVLTVHPRTSVGLRVNLETAPVPVLRALVRGVISDQMMSVQEADHLVEKVTAFRSGEDGRDGTIDDKIIDFSQMDLDADEMTLAEKLSRYRIRESDYLRIRSRGSYRTSHVTLEAVVYRPALAIVDWRSY
jgi:hypothetical protein